MRYGSFSVTKTASAVTMSHRSSSMKLDSDLLSTVLHLLSGLGVLRQRKMFGGIYIYCDDLFIATVHDDTLYFKANASTAADFVARGLPIFSYPKEGGIATLHYYQAPPEVFIERTAMKHWAEKAIFAAKQDAATKLRKARSTPKTGITLNKKTTKGTRGDD
jgi:DNA transformation protein and related proteins